MTRAMVLAAAVAIGLWTALVPALATAQPSAHAAGSGVRRTPGGTRGSGTRGTVTAGHIVYTGMDGNLYAVRPDGSGQHILTTDGSVASPYMQPMWSPSGTGVLAIRTAVSFVPTPQTGLWLVGAGGGARRLTSDVPRGFAWAPDGHTVVYEQGYPPAATMLVQLDTFSGKTRQTPCSTAFTLDGVTAIGNRALGVQSGQVEAIALSSGTPAALTSYGAGNLVAPNLAIVTPSGGAVLYAQQPGTRLVVLNLRTGRGTTATLPASLIGGAASPDLHTVAYTTGSGSGTDSAVAVAGHGSQALRGASYVTAQAFSPAGTALTYTSRSEGAGTVYTAPVTCPQRCAVRVGRGENAAWGP